MLSALLVLGYYNTNLGKAVFVNQGILLPSAWFHSANHDDSAELTDLERVYNLTYFDDLAETVADYVILMETVYNMTAKEFSVPLDVYYQGRIYYMLTPAAQDRYKFDHVLHLQANRGNTDVYFAALTLYYAPTNPDLRIVSAISDGDSISDVMFSYVTFTHKMQDFTTFWLNKSSDASLGYETFPVVECYLHDKNYFPYKDYILFDPSPEDNAYAPYLHSGGIWVFKPRAEIPADVYQRVNSGDLIFTKCNLFLCKKQNRTLGREYVNCSKDLYPVLGLTVDYKLPDETLDASTATGFSIMCVVFALIFVAFIYISIRTQRARARRVTDKNKNKLQAKEGGGKAGRKGDDQ